MELHEAIERLQMWLDMLADEIAGAEDPERFGDDERELVVAGRRVLAELRRDKQPTGRASQ